MSGWHHAKKVRMYDGVLAGLTQTWVHDDGRKIYQGRRADGVFVYVLEAPNQARFITSSLLSILKQRARAEDQTPAQEPR